MIAPQRRFFAKGASDRSCKTSQRHNKHNGILFCNDLCFLWRKPRYTEVILNLPSATEERFADRQFVAKDEPRIFQTGGKLWHSLWC